MEYLFIHTLSLHEATLKPSWNYTIITTILTYFNANRHPTTRNGVQFILLGTVPSAENHSTKWLPSLPSIERYGPQQGGNGGGVARSGVQARIERPPSLNPAELHTNMTRLPHVPCAISLKYRAMLLEDLLLFSSIILDETFLSRSCKRSRKQKSETRGSGRTSSSARLRA